jgi:hypothetical protein
MLSHRYGLDKCGTASVVTDVGVGALCKQKTYKPNVAPGGINEQCAVVLGDWGVYVESRAAEFRNHR